MDPFELVLKRFQDDARSLHAIAKLAEVPVETLRDIRSGKVRSPRLDTLRKLMAFYGARKGNGGR